MLYHGLWLQMLRELKGHTGPVYSVALSSDESKLVSSSGDGTVRVWSLQADDSYGQVRIAPLSCLVADLSICVFAAASEVGWTCLAN
jgi:WD40 repeat protein